MLAAPLPVTLAAEPACAPHVLAAAHRVLPTGAPLRLVADTAVWPADRLADVVEGGGFSIDEWRSVTGAGTDRWYVGATRAWSLPDTVQPGMRLLVCGLNPSPAAADAGVPFARPGNRFWPAALAARVVTRDRDPEHALAAHGIGMTDLVKTVTRRADELTRHQYAEGLARVTRLVEWLRPGAVCFVGLAGWRAVVDARAEPGPQATALGGRPVYVMPSTSGLNARVALPVLAAHLGVAVSLGC